MRPVPLGGSFISVAMAGKIDASVLPPAVGASTTAFLPSRIAAPASSCTGRRLVQPRRETIASRNRAGNLAKVLMRRPCLLERQLRVTLLVVGFRVIGRQPLRLSPLVLCHLGQLDIHLLGRIEGRIVEAHVEYADQGA